MNRNKWIPETHRWLSIIFSVGVNVNGVAVAQKKYAVWVDLMALIPMALRLFTGLYLLMPLYAASGAWSAFERAR